MIVLYKTSEIWVSDIVQQSDEERELDFARMDFENEWQLALDREDITNVILFGAIPEHDINAIKNQARQGSAPI